jgi:tRNA/tmRNA/rRNA uracil-C5-methylase (TrmA/RlmC/RlmD family)
VKDQARFGYREKTVLFAQLAGNRWEFGMRIPTERWGEFDFVAIPDCPVHSPRLRDVLKYFSSALPVTLPLAFISVSGAIVTLVLRQTGAQEELESVFDTRAAELRRLGVEGIYVCLNASAGQRVFLGHWKSRGWRKVWGSATAVAPNGLRYGPQSFQQLIPELHEDALSEVKTWLGPRAGISVLDLYSGVGSSIKIWKEAGASVLGVELLGEAAEIGGSDILQGRVSERLPQLQSWLRGPCVVFTNPPRTGMEPEAVEWLARHARPSRIAYLSCSAGTLARDLAILANSSDCAYRVSRIIPYDFFPQTQHVESLALLELDGHGDSSGGERIRRPE